MDACTIGRAHSPFGKLDAPDAESPYAQMRKDLGCEFCRRAESSREE